jgi:hypothetical protein
MLTISGALAAPPAPAAAPVGQASPTAAAPATGRSTAAATSTPEASAPPVTSAGTPSGGTATGSTATTTSGLPSTDEVAELVDKAEARTALAALGQLAVKGRAPKTGYSRDHFGPRWADVDRNGCDTRNDILQRDLTGIVFKPGTRDCVVLSGTLAEPYAPKKVDFLRGQDTSTAVQIDHVVALSDAWQKGAQQWDVGKRTAFANDPLNLLAVDGPLNMAKGDGDAATWLPPNKQYRCPYVARQVAVKAKYGAWVTQAEQAAIAKVLSACPNEPLPAASAVAVPVAAKSVAKPVPKPATTTVKAAPKPAPKPAKTTAKTTVKKTTAPKTTLTVHPGSFCSPLGATGVTTKGTPMVCKTTETDSKARWRKVG